MKQSQPKRSATKQSQLLNVNITQQHIRDLTAQQLAASIQHPIHCLRYSVSNNRLKAKAITRSQQIVSSIIRAGSIGSSAACGKALRCICTHIIVHQI